jgi:hypothetical protein
MAISYAESQGDGLRRPGIDAPYLSLEYPLLHAEITFEMRETALTHLGHFVPHVAGHSRHDLLVALVHQYVMFS